MKIFNSLEDFDLQCDTAITIGKFDGLHRGHKILCENLFSYEKKGLKSLLISFVDSKDNSVNKTGSKQIVTPEERRLLVKESGISIFVECLFDEKLMKTSPRDFILKLVNDLHMKCLVVGTDFRFGYKGKGDIVLLREYASEFGFELKVINKLKEDNIDISSSRIREEISKGNITKANLLMGRNYFIYGEVVYGRQIGRKIDFPTINIIPSEKKLIPANGVYITVVQIDNRIYQGITNVGIKPTFDDDNTLSIETHIFNFDSNVYGKEVKVVFLQEMRKEIKFSSAEELKEQLKKDKNKGMDFFANEHINFAD
ncbi:MAG: bifunctional riboflavin kinase/FAD synthetase [Lachnospiraceae bacterium]|nr:bifunctional riboflavin kinase/FAD synthetase [Lachnospiraceae bacterium]